MTFGFAWFLAAVRRGSGFMGSLSVMIAAGFIKHNIIAMPVTAFVWLCLTRPREAVKCSILCAVIVAAGFAACGLFYGHDFFGNMMSARAYSWRRALGSIRDIRFLDLGIIATAAGSVLGRKEMMAKISASLALFSAADYLLQKTGAGVDINAAFDLIIAVSIGAGYCWKRLASLESVGAGDGEFRSGIAANLFILLCCLRFIPLSHFSVSKPVRMLFDRRFKEEIAVREQAMKDDILAVEQTPGDVMCSTYVCYRAGKPLVVDKFNVRQRMITGRLPADAIKTRIKSGKLTDVEMDRRADWDEPLDE